MKKIMDALALVKRVVDILNGEISVQSIPDQEEWMIREYWNSFVNFMPYPSRELRRFGALIMGSGMSLCMTELGIGLGSLAVIIGIAVGLIGIVMVSLAYPVYHRILKKEREKIADEILHLTDELMCL